MEALRFRVVSSSQFESRDLVFIRGMAVFFLFHCSSLVFCFPEHGSYLSRSGLSTVATDLMLSAEVEVDPLDSITLINFSQFHVVVNF